MDCKKALEASDGNFDKAVEYLRKKGLSAATKRSSKAAKDGVVASYIHMQGKIGVLVEVNCETDFVARTEAFQTMAKDIAMHVAASNPTYLNPKPSGGGPGQGEGDLPEQAKAEGSRRRSSTDRRRKAEKITRKCASWTRIHQGHQYTVATLVQNMIANTGENIMVRRFALFQLGEELK